MVNFPTRIPDWDSQSCLLAFIFSDTSICATMAFLPLVNSDIIVSVSIDLSIILITTGCLVSLHCLWLFLCWLRCSMKDIFKLGSFTAASDFCEWVQLAIDVYISHGKYQVKPHTSPWFSATCAAAIVHRNHFFCLYKKG